MSDRSLTLQAMLLIGARSSVAYGESRRFSFACFPDRTPVDDGEKLLV
jgi:hypothetical protein